MNEPIIRAVAAALHEAKPEHDDAYMQWLNIVATVTQRLDEHHYRFQPGKFLDWCREGVPTRQHRREHNYECN